MQYNTLGATGLKVSNLGFGCGAIGGLLVRGEYPVMRHAVARAIELGIAYFDTAALYGNGQSEVNLGAIVRELGVRDRIVIGTKVRPADADLADIGAAIVRQVEAGLRRLGLPEVDLIQVHNQVGAARRPDREDLTPADLEAVAEAFSRLHAQGKARCWGMNGIGETPALRQAIAAARFQTIQVAFNLLNPSAALAAPHNLPYQDYQQIVTQAAQNGMGVIAIRILAGGALSGSATRHPVAAQSLSPLGTGQTFAADVAAAQRFSFLVESGAAGSLVEAAIRFATHTPGVSTALIGVSSLEQLEQAAAAVERGPLPPQAIADITAHH